MASCAERISGQTCKQLLYCARRQSDFQWSLLGMVLKELIVAVSSKLLFAAEKGTAYLFRLRLGRGTKVLHAVPRSVLFDV